MKVIAKKTNSWIILTVIGIIISASIIILTYKGIPFYRYLFGLIIILLFIRLILLFLIPKDIITYHNEVLTVHRRTKNQTIDILKINSMTIRVNKSKSIRKPFGRLTIYLTDETINIKSIEDPETVKREIEFIQYQKNKK